MKPGIVKLIAELESKGYGVSIKNNGSYEISKPNHKRVTLVIGEDGLAYRGDVHAELALTVRTIKQMREILGV
jgi:alpha-mannosidase